MKCTIIIPTYNRPRYLNRILSYYDEYGKDYKIIVADSSSDENKRTNEKSISSFSSIKVSHIKKYPPDLDPNYKIVDALKHVNTEYCVICADDDFIAPNGINQSVDFLEENPDFTIAYGDYISFYLKSDKEGKEQFCWVPVYSHKSDRFTSPDPKSRLIEHLSNYSVPTFYAVHRTNFLKMIFEETTKFTDDYRFGELLPSILTLIHGKMKRLEVLYGARQTIPGSSGQSCEHLSDFINDGTYDKKYARFRDCLAAHLSKKSQLDIEESKRVIDNAMSAYMKNKYYPVKPLISKMADILDYLRLPDWMDKSIRALYRALFLRKQKSGLLISPDISGGSKYYDDFNKIRLHVLSHSEINLK